MSTKPRFSDKWHLVGEINRDPTMTDAARRCAWVLLDYFNLKTELCFPSYDAIARRAGIPVRTAKSAVSLLVTKGWFHKRRRGGRGHSNHYRPAFERVQPGTPFNDTETVQPTAPFSDDKGCNPEQQRVPSDAIKGAIPRRERVSPTALESENHNKDSKTEHHQGTPDGADDAALRVAQFFVKRRSQLYPDAKMVKGKPTVEAARELIRLAEGDMMTIEMIINGCMRKMVGDGKPAPTSPLFCRYTLEDSKRV